MVLFGYLEVFNQYDTVVLATPPWDESLLCHVALIHKGDSGQECSIEGPANPVNEILPDVVSSDRLTRNEVYATSMTVAAIAAFGSTVLAAVHNLSKSDQRMYKIEVSMIVMGPFLFAVMHVYFATSASITNHLATLPLVGFLSLLFLTMTAFGVFGVLRAHKK